MTRLHLRRALASLLLLIVAVVGLGACGGSGRTPPAATSADPTGQNPQLDGPKPPTQQVPTPTPTQAAVGTVAPGWLGSRVLPLAANGFGQVRRTPPALRDRRFTLTDTTPALPGSGFASRVERAPVAVIARSTWRPGCPVAAADLDWVRLSFWGFDDRRHTGELLLAHTVSRDIVGVFRTLYRARFPIEEMRITRADELDAPPTGDGNNTSAFSCRPVVGQTTFSQHAYGLAIDVDPFQNPYVKGTGPDRVVIPELASAYLDRGRRRPGMIEPDDRVVRAFARIGWEWGGAWRTLQDIQHFSQNGT